ncbi:hypothetical protein QTO01_02420 [Vibrio mytili]|uniref:hypothetical protein n=1 Tax=Vibrio mytili TaxID=50718 RepID=UPI000A490AB6|nr:hypothetical protein [Vibrio mytili]
MIKQDTENNPLVLNNQTVLSKHETLEQQLQRLSDVSTQALEELAEMLEVEKEIPHG